MEHAVFLPTSLHQLLYCLSRDNLKHFYLPNLFHHSNCFLIFVRVPCTVLLYLAYATLISTSYYYYYYYYQSKTGILPLCNAAILATYIRWKMVSSELSH